MLYLKPEIWAQLSVGERMERLLGWSLDDCKAILEWDVNNPDITHGTRNIMMNAKIQVIKAVLMTTVKTAEQNRRIEDQRDAIFGEMAAEYRRLKAIDGGKKGSSQARK